MPVSTSRTARILWRSLGFLMVGIAFVGIFLPLIPTTGPVLLAAYSFSKSSARFDRWLVNHRWFGPTVRSWRLHRGFTMRVKRLSAFFIVLTFSITTWWLVSMGGPSVWVAVGLDVFAIMLISWIWRRPTVSEDDRLGLMAIPYEQLVA